MICVGDWSLYSWLLAFVSAGVAIGSYKIGGWLFERGVQAGRKEQENRELVKR